MHKITVFQNSQTFPNLHLQVMHNLLLDLPLLWPFCLQVFGLCSTIQLLRQTNKSVRQGPICCFQDQHDVPRLGFQFYRKSSFLRKIGMKLQITKFSSKTSFRSTQLLANLVYSQSVQPDFKSTFKESTLVVLWGVLKLEQPSKLLSKATLQAFAHVY